MRRRAVECPMAVSYLEVLAPVIGLILNVLFQSLVLDIFQALAY